MYAAAHMYMDTFPSVEDSCLKLVFSCLCIFAERIFNIMWYALKSFQIMHSAEQYSLNTLISVESTC